MKKIIGVVSGKGGVGTSSVCVGLARALACAGERVCLVDCKHRGNLDILTGLQDDVLFGFDDVCRGRELSEVAQECAGFSLCSAPYDEECDHKVGYGAIERGDFDFIILDSPSTLLICTDAVLVTTSDPSSVRATEQIAQEVHRQCENVGVLVNRFAEFEKAVSVEKIMDLTHAKLIGVVPYIPFLFEGEVSYELTNALCNAADRIKGESVPVFDGSKYKNRFKRILTKNN